MAKVTDCVHVDKQLLAEALDCLYNKPLQNKSDECKCGECSGLKTGDMIRTPRFTVKASDIWQCHNTTVSNDELQVYYSSLSNGGEIIESNKLKNGLCCFKIKITTENSDNNIIFLFSIYNNTNNLFTQITFEKQLYNYNTDI